MWLPAQLYIGSDSNHAQLAPAPRANVSFLQADPSQASHILPIQQLY